jgi:hypothetical protein
MGDVDVHAETLASASADAGAAARTLADARRVQPTEGVIGKHFAHFRVDKEIGRGGMGEVYLATDLALDRPVALKLLPRDIGKDPDFRVRFVREARAQARIGHTNICHIYFIGEQDEQLFFAMEYIEGENLQQRLERDGKLAPGEAVELVRQAPRGCARPDGTASRTATSSHRTCSSIATASSSSSISAWSRTRRAPTSRRPSAAAPSSARRCTWRPSRRAATTSTSAPTSTRSA